MDATRRKMCGSVTSITFVTMVSTCSVFIEIYLLNMHFMQPPCYWFTLYKKVEYFPRSVSIHRLSTLN